MRVCKVILLLLEQEEESLIPKFIPSYIKETQPVTIYGSYEYRIDLKNNRIVGFIDNLDSVKQACEIVLMTELHNYAIYPDHDYGIVTKDLYGKDCVYVKNVLERRIKDALSVDNRITGVSNYSARIEKEKVIAEFTVESTEGDFNMMYEYLYGVDPESTKYFN